MSGICSDPVRCFGLHKNAVGFAPFVRFCVATFWAGVNTTHCPITCPKRHIPRTLCVTFICTIDIIYEVLYTLNRSKNGRLYRNLC